MTYTIPPDAPKAAKARAFGQEMVKACKARDVTLNELARAVGVGHTALDHYRTGSILPKTATGREMARVLRWPKLAEILDQARTFVCARPGCGRSYRHEGGGPRKFCTDTCVRINANQRIASRRLRQAGQTDDGRLRAAAIARLRSAARIADERAQVAEDAIGVFCRSCEPEGVCRTVECPLRVLSPLPLYERGGREAKTETELRRERRWTPEHRAKHAAAMRSRWDQPGAREAQAARSQAWHEDRTPEEREAWRQKVGMAQMSPERRSAVASKGATTRRTRREAIA